ncbi:MAG: tetratricopeptide repeat protein [Prevotella sp.]|nr:tetratricopeptide repeat protein [Prevotella sp.]
MEIAELIEHPERLDRDTLYELRSLLALYPYFQTARLLMLQNLFLLHDPTFDDELRRAAIYITDRKVLFQMIEAGHYQLRGLKKETADDSPKPLTDDSRDSRTLSLIDDFLDSLPKEDEQAVKKEKRKPTPADAAVDYVAYLLESESDEDRQFIEEAPQLIGQSLIDSFLEQDKGKLKLNENPLLKPEIETSAPNAQKSTEEGYYTETLARIYIKQGNYSKALEIIQRLSLENTKKNVYFADQIRFLQKLIINNNKK